MMLTASGDARAIPNCRLKLGMAISANAASNNIGITSSVGRICGSPNHISSAHNFRPTLMARLIARHPIQAIGLGSMKAPLLSLSGLRRSGDGVVYRGNYALGHLHGDEMGAVRKVFFGAVSELINKRWPRR